VLVQIVVHVTTVISQSQSRGLQHLHRRAKILNMDLEYATQRLTDTIVPIRTYDLLEVLNQELKLTHKMDVFI